jgi:hypothetical protein
MKTSTKSPEEKFQCALDNMPLKELQFPFKVKEDK